MTDNSNPGNFANRPKEDVQNIASKGGQTGTENLGSAPMDKEKVECHASRYSKGPGVVTSAYTISQQDIASQGGKASSGSFEKGSEAAKEAGRKGGQTS